MMIDIEDYIYFDSYGKEILQKLDGDRKYLQIVSDYGPKWIWSLYLLKLQILLLRN